MIFFDTNVLIYSTVNLDKAKQKISDSLIEEALKDKSFFISPLVVTEFVFVLAKLKIEPELVEDAVSLFRPFVKLPLDASMVFDAYKLCDELKCCKNINDAVHLKFAEKYCSSIVTFDKDFKKFMDSTKIEIRLL